MFIGYLRINIFIPHSQSLKDRRRVVESLKVRARNKFNVSLAQKPSDQWKNCELFFVSTNYTKERALDIIDRLEDFICFNNDIHIATLEKGVL